MRLLTKIFLLSYLLLPMNLSAVDLSHNSYDDAGSTGKTYLKFSGAIPLGVESNLTGFKDTQPMDIIKMEQDNGFGFNVAAGYISTDSNLAFELEGGILMQTDKKKELTTKKGENTWTKTSYTADGDPKWVADSGFPKDEKAIIEAGHVTKIEYKTWNALVNLKYLVSMNGKEDTADNMMQEEMKFSPFVTAGLGVTYKDLKVTEVKKGDVKKPNVDPTTTSPTASGEKTDKIESSTISKGAALDDKAITQVKKLDKGDFLLAYQIGAGFEVSMGDSALLLGYRYFGTKDPKFEETIETIKYSLTQDDNKTHLVEMGFVFAF